MTPGILVDAACKIEPKTDRACNPTRTTTSFALITSGEKLKTLTLDAAGDAKAAAAVKASDSEANRTTDPNAVNRSLITTVVGTISGDEIKVESVKID